MKELHLPLSEKQLLELRAGECVSLFGTLYTARDCAHRRFMELLDRGEKLPFDPQGAFLYYAGPCPAPEGKACGSCGPTTSARMNAFAPRMLQAGVKGLIGKGEMSKETREALKSCGAVYFAAIGGAGAFYGNAIRKMELVAFPDLLSEAVYRLEAEGFPLVVAHDAHGGNIY